MKDQYIRIVKKLNLNVSADISSSKNLELLLKETGTANNRRFLNNLTQFLKIPCLIAGGGPSIEEDLTKCIDHGLHEKLTLIAVDGTCKLFHEVGVIPNILVTDLDGDWSSIFWAIRKGTTTLIHAHGDNHQLINQFFFECDNLRYRSNIWGTTQNFISSELFNFGGFTDGDRAILLAFHFQTPIIGLIGFDFGKEIGEYSLSHQGIIKDISRKKLKFEIAIGLLNKFHQDHKGIRFNLTSGGIEIPGFPRSTLSSFVNIINKGNVKHNSAEFPKSLL